MPPLPDSMHYPMSGWWWLHAFSIIMVFCWGWYHGQNRAQARFAKYLKLKQDETRWPGFARVPRGEHEGDAEGAERPGGPPRSGKSNQEEAK